MTLPEEKDAEIDRELENAQWLRFAEVVASWIWNNECRSGGNPGTAAGVCADFADAMVREAKERGRL